MEYLRWLIFLMPITLGAQHHCSVWYDGNSQKRLSKFEEKYRSLASKEMRTTEDVYRIPVVFHVIHWDEVNNGGEVYGVNENIPDEYLDNALVILNEDFRKKAGRHGGANPTSTDAKIEFCRASQDPFGNPITGIFRLEDNVTVEFMTGANDWNYALGISNNWEGYLNIYVVQSIWMSFYGFADIGGNDTFVDYRFFAPNANSDIWYRSLLTHEIGHILSLNHTFGGITSCVNNDCLLDGDKVCDTEPNNYSSYVDCSSIYNSCVTDVNLSDVNNPFTTDRNDDLFNYMLGGSFECENKFTAGQVARMRAFVETGIFNLGICENESTTNTIGTIDNVKSAIRIFPNPTSDQIFIHNIVNGTKMFYEIHNALGRAVVDGTLLDDKITVSTLEKGIYFITLKTSSADIIVKEKLIIQD